MNAAPFEPGEFHAAAAAAGPSSASWMSCGAVVQGGVTARAGKVPRCAGCRERASGGVLRPVVDLGFVVACARCSRVWCTIKGPRAVVLAEQVDRGQVAG